MHNCVGDKITDRDGKSYNPRGENFQRQRTVARSRNQIIPLRRLILRNSSIIPLKAPVAEHYKDVQDSRVTLLKHRN